MPVLNLYKSDFNIITYDQDSVRGEKIHGILKRQGYSHKSFSNKEALNESLKTGLPHIVILHYQPLNLEFHGLLQKLRKMSDEVEIVVLSGSGFWPGINKLLKTNLIDDFWLWPPVNEKVLSLRLDQIIEKTIFKFIAEQRSGETSRIVNQIEDLKKRQKEKPKAEDEPLDLLIQTPFDLKPDKDRTETELVTHFIEILKGSAMKSEFVYLRNYPPRSQLLVMGTSFSSEKHLLGRNLSFNLKDFDKDQEGTLKKLGRDIKKIFHCDFFTLNPVRFMNDFYGFLVAFNFDSGKFLKRMARYLSIHLRNLHLEKLRETHTESSGKNLHENLSETDTALQKPLNLKSLDKGQSHLPGISPGEGLNREKKFLHKENRKEKLTSVLEKKMKPNTGSDKTEEKLSGFVREEVFGKNTTPSKNLQEFSENCENLKKILFSEVKRSQFTKSPLSLIIGHFSFLYDQNETVEKSLELIKNQLSCYDLTSRIGFSKIALVFPHCSFREAAIKSEKVRRQLAGRSIETNNPALRLCFGVSEFPKWSVSGESLFSTADKACSQVFHSGKNKVCLFSREMDFKPDLSL